MDMWSRKHKKCIQCGLTKFKHISHGLCKNCYVGNDRKQKNNLLNLELITSGGIESIDYVFCNICGLPFKNLTEFGHLRAHKITVGEYKDKFPNSNIYCERSRKLVSNSVSNGRKKLMKERGYLNPQSQRILKSKEMARKHALKEFSKVSKIEDDVSEWFISNGYSILWNDDLKRISKIDNRIIIRQYLFMDCYCVDFAYPFLKTVIEVLGDWWHGWKVIIGTEKIENQHSKVKRNMKLDIERFNYIERNGWKLIKIWEHDIRNNKFVEILKEHFN